MVNDCSEANMIPLFRRGETTRDLSYYKLFHVTKVRIKTQKQSDMQWNSSATGFVMFWSAEVLKPIFKDKLSLFFRRDSEELAVAGSELNLRLAGLGPAALRSVPSTPGGAFRHSWPQLLPQEAQGTHGSHVTSASLLPMCDVTWGISKRPQWLPEQLNWALNSVVG